MKKTRLITVSLWAVVLMLLAAPGKGTAGVQVSIGLAAPFPAVIVPQPVAALPHSPRHVAVPKTDSYYYPLDSDSLYYGWQLSMGRTMLDTYEYRPSALESVIRQIPSVENREIHEKVHSPTCGTAAGWQG